jgi:hypothetical protein
MQKNETFQKQRTLQETRLVLFHNPKPKKIDIIIPTWI